MATIRIPGPRRLRGMTLVESAVTVALAAVVLGLAVPGFATMHERERLRGVAAQLETDIMFARSLAAAQSASVRLEFDGAHCWLLHDGAAGCRCDGITPDCEGRSVLRYENLGPGHPVQVQSNSASMVFEPTRGTVTPTATVRLSLPSGPHLHLVVNLMGRVRRCSPDGLPGEVPC
ncbi:GspH/FimT family pseudopilin [Rubrivivax gelatinosus]|uniref:Type II secretion system protein H n=1 Tax=Rubrivivax gelatinosus TaxID=28068 RepID=A0A4R2MHA0_RUBGE|nr:GspH/FimT family pseudopilin [Rubrivivax gelatinosus]MBK1689252.1 fimbrial assembly protein [Rubrivivax gelatinosus]TCO98412.1 type IV fimbrial biogenesis protein FimT [Rubrivivax gelatinosus]